MLRERRARNLLLKWSLNTYSDTFMRRRSFATIPWFGASSKRHWLTAPSKCGSGLRSRRFTSSCARAPIVTGMPAKGGRNARGHRMCRSVLLRASSPNKIRRQIQKTAQLRKSPSRGGYGSVCPRAGKAKGRNLSLDRSWRSIGRRRLSHGVRSALRYYHLARLRKGGERPCHCAAHENDEEQDVRGRSRCRSIG